MLNRLVPMICAIPLSSISDNLWSQRPPGGEGDLSPYLQPVKLPLETDSDGNSDP